MRRATAVAVAVAAATYGAVWLVNRSLVDVRGPSMAPALVHGDRLVTVPVRAVHRLRPGQVVVAVDPDDPTHLVIKRVVRVAGDGVDLRGDNAPASTDSRRWGPVAPSAVRRLALRRWPDLTTPLSRPGQPLP